MLNIYKEAKFNSLNDFPETAKKNIVQKIGQHLEDNGQTGILYNNPGKEKVDKVVEEMIASGEMNEQEKHIYDSEREDLGTLKSLMVGSPIPTADVINSASEGLKQGVGGMLSSARDISNKATLGAFQKLGLLEQDEDRTKRLQEEAYSTSVVQGKGLHAFTQGAGGFIGFATPMILGSMAGSPVAATALMQFEGINADHARELFPKEIGKQNLYTILSTTIDASLMEFLPTKKAGDAIK